MPLGCIPDDWPRYPTGALLLALDMLPFAVPRLLEVLDRLAEEDPTLRFSADVARGTWVLRA